MWLYLPKSLLSQSAPVSADWTSDSNSLPNSLARELVSSVTSRGSTRPPRYWLGEWKRDTSPLRRFGPTLIHSQQSLHSFVERFTASLPDIHASRSAQPAGAEALPIRDTFSRIFDARSAQSNLFSVSSKTSADTCPLDSTAFKGAYDEMVTTLSLEYSQRPKLEQVTDVSGYSFWPTAVANDDNKSVAAHLAMKARMPGGPRTQITSLQVKVQEWQTPAPDSFRSRGGDRVDEMGLDQQARFWSTPNAHDGRRPGIDDKSTQGANLNRDASQWGTPTSRDHKDGASTLENTPVNGLLGRQVLDFSRQGPESAKPGSTSSNDIQNSRQHSASTKNSKSVDRLPSPNTRLLKRRLNPTFVEWLMGLPREWTGYGPVEMPSFRSALLTRLSLLLERQG